MTHQAIAARIISEFKSNKRLCPDSIVDELKALRDRLMAVGGDA